MGWIGPAITGASALGSAALGGKGANQAAQIQAQSNREAINLKKAEDAQAQKNFEAQQQAAQAAWNAYQAYKNPYRRALAARLGINIPDVPMGSAPPPGWTPGSSNATPAAPAGTQSAQLMASNAAMPLTPAIQPTLKGLSSWSQWGA